MIRKMGGNVSYKKKKVFFVITKKCDRCELKCQMVFKFSLRMNNVSYIMFFSSPFGEEKNKCGIFLVNFRKECDIAYIFSPLLLQRIHIQNMDFRGYQILSLLPYILEALFCFFCNKHLSYPLPCVSYNIFR